MLLVSPDKMAAYGIEITFAIRNARFYPSADGVSLKIFSLDKDMEVVEKVAETEAIYGQSDAFFTEKLNLNYRIEKMQRYRVTINVLNSSTKTIMGSMGTADFDISMMFACGGRLILLIASPLAPCSLEIVGKVPDYYSQFLRIRFSGNYLHSPSDVIPLQLYYILSIPTEERTIMLYKSEMLRETKYPEWAAFSIPLFLLNYFNESSIQLHVYNYTPNHDDQLVGHCTTTLTQLQQGVGHFNSYMLMEPNGKRIHEKTCIELKELSLENGPTFFQMMENNVKIQLTSAIDLTASNGNPVNQSSLHYIHPHQPSPYLEALLQTVPPLLAYLPNPQNPHIGALGFGAKVQVPGGALQLSHCFCLNGTPTDPRVEGLGGLLSAYRTAVMGLQPFAPTDFSEVIYFMSKFAKAESRRHVGLYFVLIIYSDGGPANALNMKRSIDAIVDASPHPMSIIGVGMGQDRDHSPMRNLEKLTLKHSDGRLLVRQNYSYVDPSDLESSDVLAMIPIQMAQWKRMFHFDPK
ncbi:VWFA domain-containing protein [Caenorhabditis elegans]|uniref:VWFA domain-containing protein n=1 Tax=Caenorhabditis elegans TaxID=6239 RepID=Q17559_CAEEL|nr:VWFA domain-containing protein [Caenorhabditis elegans]CAA92434.2 VWFA domain-containing protein [Caenorhabditis elegans]|eukprot:NP_501584.2 CoPiNe domain protein, Atypical [Caenorhabditis elegans]